MIAAIVATALVVSAVHAPARASAPTGSPAPTGSGGPAPDTIGATQPAPTPPGGGAPGAPVSGGWQDAQASLRTLDLRTTGQLDERSLYRLTRTGVPVWEPVDVGAVTRSGSDLHFTVVLRDATSQAGKADVFRWDAAANHGAGALTVRDVLSGIESPVTSAGFVYDGTHARIGVRIADGQFLLLPGSGAPALSGAVLPVSLPEMLGAYLGYQPTPPDLTVLTSLPSGFSLDPAAVYQVFGFSTVSGVSMPWTPNCVDGGVHRCFQLRFGGSVWGSLDVTPDLVMFTSASGTYRVTACALAYPLSSALPAAPLLAFTANGKLYSLPLADPAGQELDRALYAPTHDAARLPVDGDLAATPIETPQPVSSAEYAYLLAHDNPAADFVVKDSYTDDELAALPQGVVPVDLSDPSTVLDAGQVNYRFSASTSDVHAFYSAGQPVVFDGSLTAAMGYAGQAGGPWRPVLALQAGPGASIVLVDLTTVATSSILGAAMSGPLGRVRALQDTSPLRFSGITSFTDANAPAAVVNPSSALFLDGTGTARVGAAVAVGVGDTPTTYAPAGGTPVVRAAYGTLEQGGGASSTKVLAVQVANGTVFLVSVAGGLTPAMTTALTLVFGPILSRSATLTQSQTNGLHALTVTYGLAAGHGLDATRADFGAALEAESLMQVGKVLPFAHGQVALTPTLAGQLFDKQAVDAALTKAQQSPDVINDEGAAFTAQAQLDAARQRPVAALPIVGGVWDILGSGAVRAHPDLAPAVAGANGAAASAQDVIVARDVAWWILQEVAVTTPNAAQGDTTLPPLAQDYRTLQSRLAAEFPTFTAEQKHRAVANAFELLGISSRQLLIYASSMSSQAYCSAACSTDAYLDAVFARAALQPDAIGFTWRRSDDPLDLGYLTARVPTVPGGSGAELAGQGRWLLATERFAPVPSLTAQAAQFASQGAFTEFPLWARGLTNSDATVKAVTGARQLALLLLNNLDAGLAHSLSQAGERDLIGSEIIDLRMRDLTPDEIGEAVDLTLERILALTRAVIRDTGLALTWYKVSAYIDQIYRSDSWQQIKKNLVGLVYVKPALALTPAAAGAAFTAALAKEAPATAIALNDAGLAGAVSGIFAMAMVGVYLEVANGHKQSVTDTLVLAFNIVLVCGTATHYVKTYALWRMATRGESLASAVEGMNRTLGLDLTLQQMYHWMFKANQFRIDETAKAIWTSYAQFRKRNPNQVMPTERIATILDDLGWRLPYSAAAELGRALPDTAIDPAGVPAAVAQEMATTGVAATLAANDRTTTLPVAIAEQEWRWDEKGRMTHKEVRRLAPTPTDAAADLTSDGVEYQGAALSEDDIKTEAEVIAKLFPKPSPADDPARRPLATTTAAVLAQRVVSDRGEYYTNDPASESVRALAVQQAVHDTTHAEYAKAFQGLSAELSTQIRDVRPNLIGRIVGLAFAALETTADVILAPLLLTYTYFALREDHSSLGIAEAVMNFGATATFMTFGILELIGAEIGLLWALPLAVVAVALAAMAVLLAIFVKPDATTDQPALQRWLNRFLTRGLVRGGEAGAVALDVWHGSSASVPAHQSFPTDCDPYAISCRMSDEPGPASTRYLLKQAGSGLCASLSDYPPRHTELALARLVSCDSPQSDSAFYVLPDIGGSTDRLVSRGHRCLDNYGNDPHSGNLLVAWGCSVTDPASRWAISDPRPDGTVTLSNPHSGMCVDSDNAQVSTGTALAQGTCTGSVTQRWTMVPAPEPSFLLEQARSGLCAAVSSAAAGQGAVLARCVPGVDRVYTLDRSDGGTSSLALADGVCLDSLHDTTTNGASIVGWSCDGSDSAQQWVVGPPTIDGTRTLTRPRKATLCLDSANGSIDNFVPLVQGNCVNAGTQQWVLVPVPPQHRVTIAQGGSGLCAAISLAVSLGRAMLAGCDAYVDRTFYLQPGDGGTVRITTGADWCLGSTGTGNGAAVTKLACHGDDASLSWRPTANTDGTTTIRNVASDRCLDTAGAATAMYAGLVIGTCLPGSSTQRWRIGTVPEGETLRQTASGNCAALGYLGVGFALADCATTALHTFIALPDLDGTGVTLVLASGACLTASSRVTGAPVAAGHCGDGRLLGQWTEVPSGAGDGSVMLRNEADGMCLDSDYAHTSAGTALVQGPCVVGAATQQWTLS